MSLLQFTSKGIYCKQADIYIDPWKKVPKALITHAHSDHAKPGHKSYLCTHETLPILKLRINRCLRRAKFHREIKPNSLKYFWLARIYLKSFFVLH